MIRDLNRYHAKLSYQRNMIIAQIVVAIMVVGSVLILDQFHNSTELVTKVMSTSLLGVEDAIRAHPEVSESIQNLSGQSQTPNRFQGQFGVKLRIVADNLELPSISRSKPEIYALDLTDLPNDEALYGSDIESGEAGIYSSENAIYVYQPPVDSKPILLTRAPRVIYREKPNTPPSAQMMGMGGVVEVLMLINPKGNPAKFAIVDSDSEFTDQEEWLDLLLDDENNTALEFNIDPIEHGLKFVTLKDEPSDFKFAKYLHAVLPKWQFIPAFEDGVPVYCFVYLQYNFCAPDDQECIELVLSI